MHIKPIILTIFLALINLTTPTAPQYIYTITHLRSYNRAAMSANLGCNHSSITYGTYTYPMGLKDALFVYLNQGTYQSYVNCQFKQVYAKVFGTEQNYTELIKNDPTTVAERVKQMVSRINPKYVVDWKCPIGENDEKARNWLDTFVEKLGTNTQVYIKAPASYFCYSVNNQRYLLDLAHAKNYIIEMYGQQPGVYISYDEIFQKQHSPQGQKNEKYSQKCAKYPSYLALVRNNPGKQFYIGKTMLKQEAGYVGQRLGKFMERAEKYYENRPVFMDSAPEQIIQL